jgi:hypothetical protein
LVVDQAPFLKKALSTCKRLRNELHKKQALLRDFEEQDRSAYWQWFNRTHGKTLTQIREFREESNAYQFILHHLSNCAYYDYKAVPELYKTLFELKKQGTLYSYEPPKSPDPFGFYEDDEDEDDEDWDDEDWDDEDDEDWDDEDEDDFRSFFDRVFGDDGAFEDSDESQGRASGARKATEDARLKTCYRNLAKRLHPDRSELEESVREKRWHEIQEAYQAGDIEALLRVEAICDMDETGLRVELGLARLRDLAAYHKSHLIPIRNALRAAKQDIAFGFSKKGPSDKLKREVASDLKYERMDVKEMLVEMQEAAVSIRDLAVEQLREEREANERAIRRAAQAKASPAGRSAGKRPVSRGAPKAKPVKQKKPEPEDPQQMSFF